MLVQLISFIFMYKNIFIFMYKKLILYINFKLKVLIFLITLYLFKFDNITYGMT